MAGLHENAGVARFRLPRAGFSLCSIITSLHPLCSLLALPVRTAPSHVTGAILSGGAHEAQLRVDWRVVVDIRPRHNLCCRDFKIGVPVGYRAEAFPREREV